MIIIMNKPATPLEQEKPMSASKPTVLVTGASTGIGAVYADRFAKRGHDLVLVARDRGKLEALATRLRKETGVAVDILQADLTDDAQLGKVETLLRDDARIGILLNNAGAGLSGTFVEQTTADTANLIGLNTVAVTRLAGAVAPRFVKEGKGAIINIGSVVGLAPEIGLTVYGATKAFVLYLSQGLHLELGPKGVYVQAVLPAATRTDIWAKSGKDVNEIPGMMEVEALVDAALVGFDHKETITIPPLHDDAQWETFDTARKAMLQNFLQAEPAVRYRKVA
jgi:short-subunit dehydrogenase